MRWKRFGKKATKRSSRRRTVVVSELVVVVEGDMNFEGWVCFGGVR